MKVIKYIRVSTQHQNKSGLGLLAQSAAIDTYIKSIGAEQIAEFTEVESAGQKDRITANKNLTINSLLKKRPVLQEAIELATQTGATILVKESSRLSRFSLLIDYLIATKVHFICTDNPTDSEFFIKLRTLFNEEEIIKISERTVRALEARRNKGLQLGTISNLTLEGRLKGAYKRKVNSLNDENNIKVMTIIQEKRSQKMKFQEIANELNRLKYKTPTGKNFQTGTVYTMLKRFEEEHS